LADSRIQVEAATVEEYIGRESLQIPVAVGFLDEALNLVVDVDNELVNSCSTSIASRSKRAVTRLCFSAQGT
jgi:hypothetical protein